MNIVEKFYEVRDIPYRIPLSVSESDECCSGKAKELLEFFRANGFTARYRMCSFVWSSLHLPEEVTAVSHKDHSTHVWVELQIDGRWVTVDATWDKGLKSVFEINEWDGKTNTIIAVPILELFSPEKSEEKMIEYAKESEILDDLKNNREFYTKLNKWLEAVRSSN